MRMSRALAAVVLHYIPECHLLISSVEAHVLDAEGLASIQTEEGRSPSWFNKYVSEQLCHQLSHTNHRSPSSLSLPQHEYAEILKWYKRLAKSHSKLVRFVPSIGKTEEERDIAAVHITASTNPTRHKFYLQCLIHASESCVTEVP